MLLMSPALASELPMVTTGWADISLDGEVLSSGAFPDTNRAKQALLSELCVK
jgi:hypothetical protein